MFTKINTPANSNTSSTRPNIVANTLFCIATALAVFSGLGIPEDVRAGAGIHLSQ